MNPVFIACTARSGSTLLRWALDSHPDVACPAETDVGQVLEAFDRTRRALFAPGATDGVLEGRRLVESVVSDHLADKRASIWCDKSISNAMHLDLLAKTWPGSTFVFLHRHVMDFIASALDAQPWGLSDYGFPQYAAQSPGDAVGALARYWGERTSRMLAFEGRTGHRTVRIRYEDLARSPRDTLRAVWKLLGVREPPLGPEGAFLLSHDSHGSADHRIWYTSGFAPSIGKGKRVAPARLQGQLRADVNRCLEKLGYATVDERWGDDHGVRLDLSEEAFVVVEADAIPGIVAGHLNVGACVRRREIRYYGPPPANYGEERAIFEKIPHLLGQL